MFYVGILIDCKDEIHFSYCWPSVNECCEIILLQEKKFDAGLIKCVLTDFTRHFTLQNIYETKCLLSVLRQFMPPREFAAFTCNAVPINKTKVRSVHATGILRIKVHSLPCSSSIPLAALRL